MGLEWSLAHGKWPMNVCLLLLLYFTTCFDIRIWKQWLPLVIKIGLQFQKLVFCNSSWGITKTGNIKTLVVNGLLRPQESIFFTEGEFCHQGPNHTRLFLYCTILRAKAVEMEAIHPNTIHWFAPSRELIKTPHACMARSPFAVSVYYLYRNVFIY